MNKNHKYCFLMAVNVNHEFLHSAIESVLHQSDPDFLFYIIANNCNDELWLFLNAYNDERIKLYRTNIGQLSYNLNLGLELIGDGYALRMDSDDVCLPSRLADTKSELEKYNFPNLLTGIANLINHENQIIGCNKYLNAKQVRDKIFYTNTICHPTVAFDVRSIINHKAYLGGLNSQDYDLWIRCFRDPEFTFAASKCVFLNYRISQYQSRGKRIGYAEVLGIQFREFFFCYDIRFLIGALLTACKIIIKSNNQNC